MTIINKIRDTNMYVETRENDPTSGSFEYFYHFSKERHGIYVSRDHRDAEVEINWYGQSKATLFEAKRLSRLMGEVVDFVEGL